MVIRITFSLPMKRIEEFARKVTQLPPLPDYITKRGPYIDGDDRARNRIVIIYEFDKPKVTKAWIDIFKLRDALGDIPGFAFSAHLLGEGKEFGEYPLSLKDRDMATTPSQNSQTFE